MRSHCPRCSLSFEPEQGYFVGAIYINYAATTLIAIAGFLTLDYLTSIALFWQLVLWGVFVIVFPLFFFRYSRSLWLSIDYLFTAADTPPRKNLSVFRRKPRE
jgi:hypothetical protein